MKNKSAKIDKQKPARDNEPREVPDKIPEPDESKLQITLDTEVQQPEKTTEGVPGVDGEELPSAKFEWNFHFQNSATKKEHVVTVLTAHEDEQLAFVEAVKQIPDACYYVQKFIKKAL